MKFLGSAENLRIFEQISHEISHRNGFVLQHQLACIGLCQHEQVFHDA